MDYLQDSRDTDAYNGDWLGDEESHNTQEGKPANTMNPTAWYYLLNHMHMDDSYFPSCTVSFLDMKSHRLL